MKHLFFLVCAVLLSMPASAADLGPDNGRSSCHANGQSSLLDLPNISQIRVEIDKRYSHALDVSMSQRIVFSRRPTYVWAIAAKVSCAKAIGYLKSGEVVADTISNCDCFHKRMTSYMPR